jgi:hypothetical protein
MWPNLALNIHENMNYVANQQVICESTVKSVTFMYVMWSIWPLLSNGSANTFPKNTLSTIGHPLLGNIPINMHSRQQKTVFSADSVQRTYDRAQSAAKQVGIEGVQRSTTEFSWKSE